MDEFHEDSKNVYITRGRKTKQKKITIWYPNTIITNTKEDEQNAKKKLENKKKRANRLTLAMR